MLLYLLLPLVAIAMLMAPLIPVYAGIRLGKKQNMPFGLIYVRLAG